MKDDGFDFLRTPTPGRGFSIYDYIVENTDLKRRIRMLEWKARLLKNELEKANNPSN